mmetsp:Transcript_10298/g.18558  ORF Transcript_10298/g.18558 Transcript_10298/m.18558 type:complete len:360 (+) Transcript_10298:337-1416(+)
MQQKDPQDSTKHSSVNERNTSRDSSTEHHKHRNSVAVFSTNGVFGGLSNSSTSYPETMPFQVWRRKVLAQMFSGAISGITTTIVFSPLDVIKTRMQVRASAGGMISVCKSMYLNEGFGSFYKGINASLWALVPTWAIYWLCYEQFKAFISQYHGEAVSVHVSHMLSAVGAGAVTTFGTSPFWVVKTRMQTELAVGKSREYPTLSMSVRKIVEKEGILGLYRGLAPSLIGLVHVGIQFPVYEEIRHRLENQPLENRWRLDPAGSSVLIASSVSKVIATFFAYPHEVLRSHLQVSRQPVKGFFADISKMVSISREIFRTQGAQGFYRGMVVNLCRTVPSTMLTFSTYDYIKTRIDSETWDR